MGQEFGGAARGARSGDAEMNKFASWRHDLRPDAQAFDRVEIVTEQELADAKYLVRSYSADRRLIVNRCIKRAARAAKGRK